MQQMGQCLFGTGIQGLTGIGWLNFQDLKGYIERLCGKKYQYLESIVDPMTFNMASMVCSVNGVFDKVETVLTSLSESFS